MPRRKGLTGPERRPFPTRVQVRRNVGKTDTYYAPSPCAQGRRKALLPAEQFLPRPPLRAFPARLGARSCTKASGAGFTRASSSATADPAGEFRSPPVRHGRLSRACAHFSDAAAPVHLQRNAGDEGGLVGGQP